MSIARVHSEQSSDGTNDTSNTEAAESETGSVTTVTGAARGRRGSRGPGPAVREVVRVSILILHQHHNGLPCRASASGIGGRGGTSVGVRRGTDVTGTTVEAGVVGAGLNGNDIRIGGRASVVPDGNVAIDGLH